MATPRTSKATRSPASTTFGKPGRQYHAPVLNQYDYTVEKTADARTDPPAFATALPDDAAYLLAGIGAEKGEANKKVRLLVYERNLTLAEQLTYGYSVSFPYREEPAYPQVSWTIQVLKGTNAKQTPGATWDSIVTIPSGHEFYELRNDLKLVHQSEGAPKGNIWENYTYIFQVIPTMAQQDAWNKTEQRLTRPNAVVFSQVYDVAPGSSDDATDPIVGLDISDHISPTSTWIRRRAISYFDELPETWTEHDTEWYRFPAVFFVDDDFLTVEKRIETPKFATVLITHSYSITEPTVDYPTVFNGTIETLLQNIIDVMSLIAIGGGKKGAAAEKAMSIARLWYGKYAGKNTVNTEVGFFCTYSGSDGSYSESFTVDASDPAEVPDEIVLRDSANPWQGGVWERVRVTIDNTTGNEGGASIPPGP